MNPSDATPFPTLALCALAAGLALSSQAHGQQPSAVDPAAASPGAASTTKLEAVTVNASADASAQGLTKPYAGGQVARGGRVGLFGNQDVMDTPFNTTSYTNQLIQDQQSRSVGDVLLNDPSVRVARGFGNFQESYFIRGFILNSDDVAYNGLYSLLPRQYISADLFERIELIRGPSVFLNGAAPGGDAIGGTVNLLPKRAPNEPLNRFTIGGASGGQTYLSADVARRFGPDGSTGLRIGVGRRSGGTGVASEHVDLTTLTAGLDWRSSHVRLSGDLGYQEHKLRQTRTNVTLGSSATAVPKAPAAGSNWAQPWSYSNERDVFGTFRGEWDINEALTAYGAYGLRRNFEANSLANLTVNDAATGAGTTYRFDNTAEDHVDTGEAGLRARLVTGPVKHLVVGSTSWFKSDRYNAYGYSAFNALRTNLYDSTADAPPALATFGNELANPKTTSVTRLTSYALGDNLSMLDDTVRLTLGLRYQRLDLASYSYGSGASSSRYEQSHTSPLAGIVYRPIRPVSVYANYAEGLSKGDTAPAAASNPNTVLSPYVAKQKEVGVKFDGGRIGGALALYTTTRPRSYYAGPGTPFTAAGEDRHRGVELTVFGEPTRGVRVLGGINFIDAIQESTGVATTEGKRVIGVPKVQGSLGTEWDLPWLTGLTLDARLIAMGPVYADAANTLKVAGWGRMDVGARYLMQVGGRLVTLRARIDNVANRDYWSSVGGYPGSGYLVLGMPRTFTVSASMDL